ncbi:MAG: peroxide stress protein YaaA [Cryomorphaceae bacterium]|nr:peroxide stress protein YaaA [Cryomorphaceae bacterium]MBT4813455.1 peroxide stress protein YaaA [Cryomorphaceae bacterium]MBT6223998.1 peroxide stress protein YaaA [Cryomorphaceae bacterium]MBT7695149.1 peroxide stress protein YaaA [Cryomorphaceae bacterium]
MKIFISPAKSLDFENKVETSFNTVPLFNDKAIQVNNSIKDLSAPDLSRLMTISPKLSDLNWLRNQDFQKNNSKEKQAIFAFNGDVYDGIDANTISTSNHEKLQSTLRILSGLYGILKPFDKIKPYRLEMGTKISIDGSKNLYDFWKKNVTDSISKEIKEEEIIINLASNEYFSVIDSSLIDNKIITPQFKDFKNGKLKIISFYAKKARGLMTRFLIDNDIQSSSDIENFNSSGYTFSQAETADSTSPVFVR